MARDRKAYNKKYYAEHREEILEHMKKYNAEHLEELKVRHRKYNAEHSEVVKARYKKWKQDNPERMRTLNKEWCQENPEKKRAHSKRWFRKNRWKAREKSNHIRLFKTSGFIKSEMRTVVLLRLFKLREKNIVDHRTAKLLYEMLNTNLREACKQIFNYKLNGGSNE